MEEIPGAGADIKRGDPKLSPDGARLALNRDVSSAPGLGDFDIWIYEFARGVFTRVTFDPADDTNPVWSPDGKQIAFARTRGGNQQIYLKDLGGGGEQQLTSDPAPKAPIDWSHDGQHLLYEERDPAKNVVSIWDLPMRGDRKPVSVLNSGFNQIQPQLSPDGKWVAYATDESGTGGADVFIQPFPPTGAKWQVSPNGGIEPRWRGDGKELYYFSAGAIWSAPIQAAGSHVQIGAVEKLFSTTRLPVPTYFYDVASDGKRFLVIQPAANRDYTLSVISNWQSTLKK